MTFRKFTPFDGFLGSKGVGTLIIGGGGHIHIFVFCTINFF